MFIYQRMAILAVCRYIYISSNDCEIVHERICRDAGHEMHEDIYVKGAWRPVI